MGTCVCVYVYVSMYVCLYICMYWVKFSWKLHQL